MADDTTNAMQETHPTHDPDRQRRNQRLPFLVAGAVAGLVFGGGAALPVWSVTVEEWAYSPGPPPGRNGCSDSRGTLPEVLNSAMSHPPSVGRVWNDVNVTLWVLLAAGVVAAGIATYGIAWWLQEWEADKHLDLPPPSRPAPTC